jgi:hypothetical protein
VVSGGLPPVVTRDVLRRAAPYVGATLLVAVAYRLVIGRALVGSDTMYALNWGHSIAHFTLPNFRNGPTQHPLANLAGTLLAPLGKDGAYDAARVLGTVYLAAAVVVLFALARELAGTAVAVLAAVLFGTSYGVLSWAMASVYDIPGLALLLGATLSAVRETRPTWRTALLLALAGLMRPDFWLFCALYSGYALWRGQGRQRWLVAALPLAAPVVWSLSDWIATGHPRFSLTHTQDLAVLLSRESGLSAVPHALAEGLRIQSANAVIVAGAVGIGLAAATRRRLRFLPPALIVAGVVVAFVVNGLENLSLIDRYLIPVGAVLSIFAAYTALGWIRERDSAVPRTVWAAGGAVVLVVLLASIPDRLDTLRTVKHRAAVRNSMQDDLRALVPRLPACQPIHTFQGFVILSPTMRYQLGDWSPPEIRLGDPPLRGIFLGPRSPADALQLRLTSSSRPVGPPRLPGDVNHSRHWSWSAVGCRS